MLKFNPPGTPAAPPKLAATLIIVRATEVDRIETLLLARAAKSSFLGSYHVFPGGKLDESDALAGRSCVFWPTNAKTGGFAHKPYGFPSLDLEERSALVFAAARESFEEAGLLFACSPTGQPVHIERTRLQTLRQRLSDGALFSELLMSEKLLIAGHDLLPYSRWITPSLEPRRFDTYFFIARARSEQEVEVDQKETVSLDWVAPADLETAIASDRIKLAPPTLRTLEELARLRSWENIVAETAARGDSTGAIVPRVLIPQANSEVHAGSTNNSGTAQLILTLPWDPEYPTSMGEGEPLPTSHPYAEGASRFVLQEGRWTSTVSPG